jgi:DNA-binding CsgD family transcriptional regulator
MEVLRVHLGSAYSAAAERTLTRQIVVDEDLGIVRIGEDGRRIDADDIARAILADGFEGWQPLARVLPDDLHTWVGVQQQSFERDPSAPLEPFIMEGRGARLRIRFVPGTLVTGPLLVVRRDARAFSTRVVHAFGLSPREAEVLRLLASGASSAAIAEALVLSQHTVHRHLQNLYAKLGVRTRTAALAKAWAAEGIAVRLDGGPA